MDDKHLLPVSILVAGILVAGSVIYSAGKGSLEANISGTLEEQESARVEQAIQNVQPVSADDHVLGNAAAKIKIIEFSDTECPFCKQFHETMNQVVEKYAGQVAWVYRHFDIGIHEKMMPEAVATECAASLGGNDAFWNYVNRLMEVTPANDGLDLAELPKIAEFAGLDATAFESCRTSGIFEKRITDNTDDAILSGGRGTPYSILVAENGEKYVINGAQPYQFMTSLIDFVLEQ